MGVAVHTPEAVLLLAPQRPFGGVESGIGEGGPHVRAVAGHGMVEAAVPQQTEVGHPGFPGGGLIGWRQVDPAAADQVGGQAVDRLQHGQAAQGGLDAARRGGPRWVFVVGAVAVAAGLIRYLTSGERRVTLALQVNGMDVVQGEPLPVILGQLTLGMEGGKLRCPGLLSGRGMLVICDVEQVHGLPSQEPAVLPSFGHAPHHRGDPAATAQGSQHPPYSLLVQFQHRGQVGHAGQGHPCGDFQQSSLFVVQWLPGRHRHPSYIHTSPIAPLVSIAAGSATSTDGLGRSFSYI